MPAERRPPPFVIVACLLRDELVARAPAGDRTAIEVLVRISPRNLPPAELARQRNERLRPIAKGLRAAVPGISDHALAKLLVAAGRRLRSDRAHLADVPPLHGAYTRGAWPPRSGRARRAQMVDTGQARSMAWRVLKPSGLRRSTPASLFQQRQGHSACSW
jgi:hypothetical protein